MPLLTISLALLTSAAPVQVIVSDARAVGVEAGEASLVADEIARALPAEAFKVTTSSQNRHRPRHGASAPAARLRRRRRLLRRGARLRARCRRRGAVDAREGRQRRPLHHHLHRREGRPALARLSETGSSTGALLDKLHEGVETAAGQLLARLRPGSSLEPGRRGLRRYARVARRRRRCSPPWSCSTASPRSRIAGSTAAPTGDGRSATALADSGRLTEALAWTFGGVGVAALVAGAAMAALGGPVAPRLVVGPVAGGGAGVSLMESGHQARARLMLLTACFDWNDAVEPPGSQTRTA